MVRGVLTRDGIDVRVGLEITRVDHDRGLFRILVDEGAGSEVVEAEALLVAAGRTPNLSDIGLETVGLDPEADRLPTDERMSLGPRLWAVGDITGKGAYTHVSKYQGAIVVRQVLGQEGPTADYRAVTRVTFTDPELAGVGLTEAGAREQGLSVVTSVADIAQSSRGWIHGEDTTGVIKLVADRDRQVLVGATAACPAGGEVLGLLSVAVHAGVPISTLRTLHFPYPTFHRAVEVALAGLDLPDMWT